MVQSVWSLMTSGKSWTWSPLTGVGSLLPSQVLVWGETCWTGCWPHLVSRVTWTWSSCWSKAMMQMPRTVPSIAMSLQSSMDCLSMLLQEQVGRHTWIHSRLHQYFFMWETSNYGSSSIFSVFVSHPFFCVFCKGAVLCSDSWWSDVESWYCWVI